MIERGNKFSVVCKKNLWFVIFLAHPTFPISMIYFTCPRKSIICRVSLSNFSQWNILSFNSNLNHDLNLLFLKGHPCSKFYNCIVLYFIIIVVFHFHTKVYLCEVYHWSSTDKRNVSRAIRKGSVVRLREAAILSRPEAIGIEYLSYRVPTDYRVYTRPAL